MTALSLDFIGGRLARGWLSVSLASGNDTEVPALNRTVLIEAFHGRGVRLIATDRYVLLRTWVPVAGLNEDDWEDEPALDEVADHAAIAIDPDGRARGMLAHLFKLAAAAAKDGGEPPVAQLHFGVIDTSADPTFDGMDIEHLAVEHPGHERVLLRCYGGDFPQWRGLLAGFEPVTTDTILLHPERLGVLAKLGKLHGGQPIRWNFGGPEKAARVELDTADGLTVYGVVMPVRADADRTQAGDA